MRRDKSIIFEWDEKKAKLNTRKHGISFDEAKSVFYDADARVILDPDHSGTEDRFILMGISERLRTLVVCHCYRKGDSIIRLISARKANRREQAIYEEHRK